MIFFNFFSDQTKYKDKSSQLFYADKFVYEYIKKLSKPIIDQYLAIRKINI